MEKAMTQRIIKFRCWDKGKKVMVLLDKFWICNEYSSIAFGSSQEEYSGICNWPIGEDTDQVIMQFTGLLDKNGKEIYEGDIVRCFDTAGEMVHDREVDFYGFRNEIWSKEIDGRTKVEILGNIYSNPALLGSLPT